MPPSNLRDTRARRKRLFQNTPPSLSIPATAAFRPAEDRVPAANTAPEFANNCDLRTDPISCRQGAALRIRTHRTPLTLDQNYAAASPDDCHSPDGRAAANATPCRRILGERYPAPTQMVFIGPPRNATPIYRERFRSDYIWLGLSSLQFVTFSDSSGDFT